MSLSGHRRDYSGPPLRKAALAPDPIEQFGHWFSEALKVEGPDANAMTLATSSREGVPSARMVLLKGYGRDGFVFFTNYRSRKGRELASNPLAALVLFWPLLSRQVRIEGKVVKVSRAESIEYFRSRPPRSRLAAAVSHQSEVLSSRDELEEAFRGARELYGEEAPPTPEWWGGYRLEPRAVEFWQGREDRLHDRFVYRLDSSGSWQVERLAP